MGYSPTISSTTLLATTGVTGQSFNSTLFVVSHSYYTERIRAFNSIEEVRADDSIPTTSNAYKGLLSAFKQPGCAVPVFLGRRKVDTTTLTPDVADNKLYSFDIKVYVEATGVEVSSGSVSFASGTSATAGAIVTGLIASMSAESITGVQTTGSVDTLILTPDAGNAFNVTAITELTDTHATTETAAELLAAIQEEDNSSWYFLTCEDHSETFILAMDSEIQATDSSDYPKQYRVAIADANVLTPLADPAVDILGKLKASGNTLTAGEWHDQADTLFPEVAATAYNGQFFPGTTTWKFMNNQTGVPAARDLVTGKKLSTQKQGYIADRNASWVGEERGVDFMHGGKVASGEWIDVIRAKHWVDSEIERRLLALFLNKAGGKISFRSDDKQLIANTVEGVLKEGVDRNILTGYSGVNIPADVSFQDQVDRILKDVTWTGYLSGAIHFVVVNGILTYQTAELS